MSKIKKRIAELRKKRQEEILSFENAIATEKTKGKPDYNKINEIHEEMGSIVYQGYDMEIDFLETEYMRALMRKNELPLPDISDSKYWIKDGRQEWVLTDAGRHQCRVLIRDENKEQMETIGFYSSILFGLLGLIIGLVSVIKS